MIAKKFQKVSRAAEAPFAFIVILILWEYGAGLIVPDYILPVPTVIVTKFWQTLSIQAHHLSVTAATTIVGLAMALFIGVLLALSVIYIRPMKAIVMPILAAFNSIPKIAISPVDSNRTVLPTALGIRATIPAKMMREIPFPIPRSVICSPSHMIKAVPAVNVITVINLNPQPGLITTAAPPGAVILSRPTLIPKP